MIIQPSPPLSPAQTAALTRATDDLRPERGLSMVIAVLTDEDVIYARVAALDDCIAVSVIAVV